MNSSYGYNIEFVVEDDIANVYLPASQSIEHKLFRKNMQEALAVFHQSQKQQSMNAIIEHVGATQLAFFTDKINPATFWQSVNLTLNSSQEFIIEILELKGQVKLRFDMDGGIYLDEKLLILNEPMGSEQLFHLLLTRLEKKFNVKKSAMMDIFLPTADAEIATIIIAAAVVTGIVINLVRAFYSLDSCQEELAANERQIDSMNQQCLQDIELVGSVPLAQLQSSQNMDDVKWTRTMSLSMGQCSQNLKQSYRMWNFRFRSRTCVGDILAQKICQKVSTLFRCFSTLHTTSTSGVGAARRQQQEQGTSPDGVGNGWRNFWDSQGESK